MSAERSIAIPTNRTSFIEGVSFRPKLKQVEHPPLKLNWADTDVHEAGHAFIAKKRGKVRIRRVTNIPGPGYLGLTELTGFDPVAAAGPHSQGANGTGGDEAIIEMGGVNIHSADHEADSWLRGAEFEVQEIANELKRHSTINETHVGVAIGRGEELKEEAETQIIDIHINRPTEKGEMIDIVSFKVKKDESIIKIPGQFVLSQTEKANTNQDNRPSMYSDEFAGRQNQKDGAQTEDSQKKIDETALAEVRAKLAALQSIA